MIEVLMLEKLRCLDSDKSNIVRCHECFQRMDRTFMVFEMLDLSLHDYMDKREWQPAPLNGIRTVMKDLATALETLKGIGLIHTDLKMDNVMLVDHHSQPFRVKLIDFGLAIKTADVWPGLVVQPLWHRSPEVLLGLPFNEAIDVWSLGMIMSEMLLGFPLFPGKHEYDVLRFIIDLLGEPPRKLLNRALDTELFFKGRSRFCVRMDWTFKTPLEFHLETKRRTSEDRDYTFSSLEVLKTVSTHSKSSFEAEDRRACVELLKDMLQLDQKKRITPKQILVHPFTTGSNNCLYGTETVEADGSSESQETEQTKVCRSSEPLCSLKELPPGVIEVQTDERTVLVEEATKESSVIRTQTVQGKMPSSGKAEIAQEFKLESISGEDWEMKSFIMVIEKSHTEAPKSSSEESLPAPVVSEPRKNTKKGIRGFFSKMKRNIFSCFCVPGQGEE
ncbi:hypothetical protein PBY51_000879 [Eleginops maclovinus]|uniref:Protein kinase domain-containing protein n=1 Tax=Eleginops maclovinus TaxID=56733 RepID=A0AAN7XMQ5_ELEMC|nr:hypothetical protein PBY51_000879 [Eleginops maclovinus]